MVDVETVGRRRFGGKHRQTDCDGPVVPEQVVRRGWREDPPTEDLPLTVGPTTAAGIRDSDDDDGSGGHSFEGALDEPDGLDPESIADVDVAAATGGRAAAEPEDAADHYQVAPPQATGEPDSAPATASRRRRGGWRILAAVGMLVALGLVAWLAVTVDDVDDPGPTSTVAPEEAVTSAPVAFGEPVTRPDGWTVQIGEPATARPNDDLELPTGVDRAVQFEITLTNDTGQPRDSAGWILKATADSRPVDLLPPDSATAPSRTILPGESLRFTVAVPMPAEENVDLLVEAGPAGRSPTLFVGQA